MMVTYDNFRSIGAGSSGLASRMRREVMQRQCRVEVGADVVLGAADVG